MCATIPAGQDEPMHEFRNEEINTDISNMGTLESDPDADMEAAIQDSEDEDGQGTTKRKKKQKKKTQNVLSLESFISMSDDGVLQSTTVYHFNEEGDADSICWDILEDGKRSLMM
jgi:hypothetical protein